MIPIDIFFKENWMFVDGEPSMMTVIIYVFVKKFGAFLYPYSFTTDSMVKMRNAVLDIVGIIEKHGLRGKTKGFLELM